MASAVLPVPGGPAKSTALPAIRLDLIKSTTRPAAYKHGSTYMLQKCGV